RGVQPERGEGRPNILAGPVIHGGDGPDFTATWTAPRADTVGTHVVKIGIFSVGWGTLFHWNNSAATFNVTVPSPPSTTTTSSSRPSTTSTSTPSTSTTSTSTTSTSTPSTSTTSTSTTTSTTSTSTTSTSTTSTSTTSTST